MNFSAPILPSYNIIEPSRLPRPDASVIKKHKLTHASIPQTKHSITRSVINNDNILAEKSPKFPSPRFDIVNKKQYSIQI